MVALVRLAGALLLGGAYAAAVDPLEGGGPSTDANATERLEALVRDMAAGQSAGGAPTPQRMSDDVVILDDEGSDRRRLGQCSCDEYRNGASASSAVCSKREGGNRVCYPTMGDGTCSDMTATLCSSSSSSGASASPAPFTFTDAEEETTYTYLNVDLQLYNEDTTSESQLPSASEFTTALSSVTGISSRRVDAITTWGAATSNTRSTSATQQHAATAAETAMQNVATTATLHATFSLRNTRRREQVEAALRSAEELPEINDKAFSIVHVNVLDTSTYPLVCDEASEAIKGQAAALLQELTALSQESVALAQTAYGNATGAAVCDNELLERIAAQLGAAATAASNAAASSEGP